VRPRFLDVYTNDYMVEDINDVLTLNQAAPNCGTDEDPYALGWIYNRGSCYLFTSKHTPFGEAEQVCKPNGAIMADIYSKEESDFIKSVLNVINPRDGTDYFLGGIDATQSKAITWQSGAPMTFKDFVNGEPAGKMYLHQDYDLAFRWNTKNDGDQDNGFICKRPQQAGCKARYQTNICPKIRNREECLTTIDSRQQYGPCGWCLGNKCQPGKTENLCEPIEYLKQQRVTEYEECLPTENI